MKNVALGITYALVLALLFQQQLAAQQLTGRIVTPTDKEYEESRLNWNQAIAAPFPKLIVFCGTTQDVQNAILYARNPANGIELVSVRSGRHSYEAFSLPTAKTSTNTMIIDVSDIKVKSLNKDNALIGAGNRQIEVYEFLERNGYMFYGGTCPTVGVSGFVLGGGYGFLARMYGMASDNLLQATVVLANGTVVIANETKHSDLLWALRGAGLGNFGVVTHMTLKVYPIVPLKKHSSASTKEQESVHKQSTMAAAPSKVSSEPAVSIYFIQWDSWESIYQVFDIWQHWAPSAPKELTAQFTIYHDSFASVGQYVGSSEDLQELIAPLLVKPSKVQVKEYTYQEAVLYFTGCDTMKECMERSSWTPLSMEAQLWKAKSIYAFQTISKSQFATLLDFMGPHFQDYTKNFAGVMIDSYGGAIAERTEHETAFFHRKALYHLQVLSYWSIHDPTGTDTKARTWLRSFEHAIRPIFSKFSYSNYCDIDIEDYQDSYYGGNAARLQSIKQSCDPDNFFRYPQSIGQ